jgi:periplasmic divalent cation tolerance protein
VPEPECILVLTTWPADADAAAFATRLVDERLAACVAVHAPMESIYRWQGTIERAAERQLVIKTSAARREALLTRLAELHPYDVPEVLVLKVDGGGAVYLKWVEGATERGEN